MARRRRSLKSSGSATGGVASVGAAGGAGDGANAAESTRVCLPCRGPRHRWPPAWSPVWSPRLCEKQEERSAQTGVARRRGVSRHGTDGRRHVADGRSARGATGQARVCRCRGALTGEVKDDAARASPSAQFDEEDAPGISTDPTSACADLRRCSSLKWCLGRKRLGPPTPDAAGPGMRARRPL